MDMLLLFIFEVLLSLAISFAVVYLIRPVLLQVLIESCGKQTRAEFWVMFTQIMLVISPLLIVIYFAPTESHHLPNLAKTIQDTLFRSLIGVFIALTTIGQVIWRNISNSVQQSIE